MDITTDPKNTYKDEAQTLIQEIKKNDEKNDHEKKEEEIVNFLQANFMNNNYSDSEDTNLDTITITTSQSSERYYSLSNHSSSDNVSCFKIGDHIREKLSSRSNDCQETKVCPKWAKYFLQTCFCLDDEA